MAPHAVPISLLGIALSALLLWLARRGKRIDEHPVCRRCGFDLFRMPPTSGHCPECGRCTRTKRAVRIGNRRRRPMLLVSGGLLFAESVASLYLLERNALSQFRPIQHVTAWWLIRHTASKNASTRDQAMAELIYRIKTNTLSASQVEQLVSLGLEHQRRLDEPWIQGWGEIIEQARYAGKGSDAQWQQYVLQAVSATFAVRPRIRRGDPLVTNIQLTRPRLGKAMFSANLPTERKIELSSLAKPGERVQVQIGESKESYSFELDQRTQFQDWPSVYSNSGVWERLPDGPQVARCRVRLLINLRPMNGRPTKEWTPPIEKEFQMQGQFVLAPGDQPTVTLRKESERRDAMRKWAASAKCPVLYWEGPSTVLLGEWSPPPPIDCAFKLYVKTRDDEHFGCEVCLRAGQHDSTGHGLLYTYDGSDHVDIILRPCATCAAKTLDLTTIWGEEVVFHDVPVRRLK